MDSEKKKERKKPPMTFEEVLRYLWVFRYRNKANQDSSLGTILKQQRKFLLTGLLSQYHFRERSKLTRQTSL